jgi:hypothetical protein
MSEAPPTRRRWYQFGLGTLFLVVTVFAMWLAWELNFIRERQAWLRLARDNRVVAKTASDWTGTVPASAQIPIWRRLLGDESIVAIRLLVGSPDEELQQVRRLFPESDTAIVTSGGIFGRYKPPETL